MICNVEDFDVSVFDHYKKAKKGKGKRKIDVTYLDCICAFDIETSTNKALMINYMYIWQFQVHHEVTVIGRRWSQFKEFIERINEKLDDIKLVVYVHNLSYEWQYLKGVLDFGEHDVFASDVRRIIKCTYKNIEFRCSMMLSNMSLKQFTHTMHVDHEKLEGSDIYDKEYFPWSDLPDHVIEYSAYDVIGLTEAIEQKMKLDGDTLYSIPLTSTGYPRRDMRMVMKYYPHKKLQAMLPNLTIYRLLCKAFRGGDVHANRFYAGKILADVFSADRSSSYPDVMCNCLFPMSEFIEETASRSRLKELLQEGKRALLFTVTFTDIQLSDKWIGDPYIPRDKCEGLLHGVFDNGRVLEAERLSMTITDIDFAIIQDEYIWTEMTVDELYSAEYDLLPKPFRHVIISYYEKKTSLKGDPDRDMEYNKSKNLLNGLYGMLAMKQLRPALIYKNGQIVPDTSKTDEELLRIAYNKAYSSYAWGVWVTAWARYRLFEGMKNVGWECFVYADTDSVKYIDHPGITWDRYNEERKDSSIYSGSLAQDAKGRVHYMGVYEPDGEYKRFITLGSKRYAYEDMDGQLHITISGVSKTAGVKELKKLENMRPGFLFQHSGKTASRYVDEPMMDRLYMRDENDQPQEIEITPYILIEETTYLMSLTDEYMDILGLLEN